MEKYLKGKKIIHIIGDSKFGGDTVYMMELAKNAVFQGAEAYICTSTKETIDFANKSSIPVILTKFIRREINPIIDLFAVFELYRIIKKHSFLLVHTHTSKPGFIGRIAATLAGTKVIFHTVHGFAFHERSSYLEYLIYSNLERIAAHLCDMIISVNNEDRITAIRNKIIAEKKIITILNGVDPAKFQLKEGKETLKRQLGLPLDCVIVVYTARLAEQKDPITFIRAAKLVSQTNKSIRFLFVGDGPMIDECTDLVAKLNLHQVLTITGFRDDVEQILNAVDIFVFPSLWEGLPIALLEAMCVGLPIIATNIKGNRECIDSTNAILIKPQNPKELANAILSLADNTAAAQKLGTAAKQRFYQKFTQDQMISNTFRVYNKIIERKCHDLKN